jgi:hypothetical protein
VIGCNTQARRRESEEIVADKRARREGIIWVEAASEEREEVVGVAVPQTKEEGMAVRHLAQSLPSPYFSIKRIKISSTSSDWEVPTSEKADCSFQKTLTLQISTQMLG